jgi:5-methylcytosine-specific restriction endonuclease McrA
MAKPDINIRSIIKECTSNFQKKQKQQKFMSCVSYIESYEDQFDKKMQEQIIHTLYPHANVNNILTKEEMVKLYDYKFAKRNQPGRKYYDKIMVSAFGGHCPYCGIRSVSTLDHYLAKTLYPTLAVSPINLIPTCRDCNTVKLDKKFSSYIDTPINPYYDKTDNEIWLEAKVSGITELAVKYKVVQPAKWDKAFYERVKKHFELFQLQELYCMQAIDEMTSTVHMLKKLKNSAGGRALYQHLRDMRESCEKVSLNSWKSGLYRELSVNEWFVETYI